MLVYSKVGVDSKKKIVIWEGPNIKSDVDIRDCNLESNLYSILVLLLDVLSLNIYY